MVISKKESEKGYHFSLNTIHHFCGDMDKRSEQKFLNYIEAIFKGNSLRYDLVIRDLSNGIIDAEKSDLRRNTNNYIFRVRDAWASYLFLDRIGSLEYKGDGNMTKSSLKNTYDRYMSKNPEFFDNIYRRTAFLTGCFVGSVLYVQQTKRNAQPFVKKFMGRKLNGENLKKLYRQGETKLRQYDSLGLVHKLNPLVADSWVSCGDQWDINEDETTFAFTLGLTLANKLAIEEKEIKEVKK